MKVGTASLLPSTDPGRGLPRSRDCGAHRGSDVYRMLQEPAEPLMPAEPKQSGSFRYLQGMLEAGEGGKTPALPPSASPLLVLGDRPLAAPSLTRPLPRAPQTPFPACVPGFLKAGLKGSAPHPTEVKFFPFFFFLPPPLRTWLLPPALGLSGERQGPGSPRNLKPTASKLGAPLSGLQGLPECTRCGHGIV